MMSVLYEKDISILSDNYFFYVQFSNQTVLVYSPHLPQHMSLYYQLNLSFPLICTYFVTTEESLLYFENKIYSLLPSQLFELQVNKSLNFERSYPLIIYNYTVTSLLNQSAIQYTPNLQYSNKQLLKPQIYQLKIQINKIELSQFLLEQSLIDRQVSVIFLIAINYLNNQYFTNETCNITNLGYSTLKPSLNYTLVTGVNNQFFVFQNNTNIQIVDSSFNFQQSYNYSKLRFTECLKSASFNLTLSSICQNNTGQYWLSISFDCFGNVSDINTFSIPGIFTNIFKINIIYNLNFILVFFQFYQSKFVFTQLIKQQHAINQLLQQIILQLLRFFRSPLQFWQRKQLVNIMNKIATYLYLYFGNNTSFQLEKQNSFFRQGKYSLFRHDCKQQEDKYSSLSQIMLNQNRLNLFDFITTIPGYGNLLPISNSIYSNGLLLQQFQQGNNYLIGVYQISNFYDNNLEDPLLLLGSQTSTSLEYAFIRNIEDQNATCIAFNNGSLLYFPIYTRIFKCHYRKRRNSVQMNILCQNQYSSGSYQITFILPELEINKRGWIFSLITIIAIQLIGFYILVRYRMRNYGHINTEIEF
ncbi:unnamed protein product [Paramecium sonneborni]|uniref:Transmembrane protein n=1 Tax=Paramecium sonneborni TaxID=65129 RepID=A0A8S1QIG1_9CILI|nr:unnamed protein product [Paramecium sonneborni]